MQGDIRVDALAEQYPNDPQVRLLKRLMDIGAPREQWEQFFTPEQLRVFDKEGLVPQRIEMGVSGGEADIPAPLWRLRETIDALQRAGPYPDALAKARETLPEEDIALLQKSGYNPVAGALAPPDWTDELNALVDKAHRGELSEADLNNPQHPANKYVTSGLLGVKDIEFGRIAGTEVPALLSDYDKANTYLREWDESERAQATAALEKGDVGGWLAHGLGGALGLVGRVWEEGRAQAETWLGQAVALVRTGNLPGVSGAMLTAATMAGGVQSAKEAERAKADLARIIQEPEEARKYWREQSKTYPQGVAGVAELGADPTMWFDAPYRLAFTGVGKVGSLFARAPGVRQALKLIAEPTTRATARAFNDMTTDSLANLARATRAKDGSEAVGVVQRFLDGDETLKVLDKTLVPDAEMTRKMREVWGGIKNKDEFFGGVTWRRGDGSLISAEEAIHQVSMFLTEQFTKKFPRDKRWGIWGFKDENTLFRLMQEAKFQFTPFWLISRPAYTINNLMTNVAALIFKNELNLFGIVRARRLMAKYPMLKPAYAERGFGLTDELLSAYDRGDRKALIEYTPFGWVLDKARWVNNYVERGARMTQAQISFYQDFSIRWARVVDEMALPKWAKDTLIARGMRGDLADAGLEQTWRQVMAHDAQLRGDIVGLELNDLVRVERLEDVAQTVLEQELVGLNVLSDAAQIDAALQRFSTRYGQIQEAMRNVALDMPHNAANRGFTYTIYNRALREAEVSPEFEQDLVDFMLTLANEEDAIHVAEGVVVDRWWRLIQTAPRGSEMAAKLDGGVRAYYKRLDDLTVRYHKAVSAKEIEVRRAAELAKKTRRDVKAEVWDKYEPEINRMHKAFAEERFKALDALESTALELQFEPLLTDVRAFRVAAREAVKVGEQTMAARAQLWADWKRTEAAWYAAKKAGQQVGVTHDELYKAMYADASDRLFRQSADQKLNVWARAAAKAGVRYQKKNQYAVRLFDEMGQIPAPVDLSLTKVEATGLPDAMKYRPKGKEFDRQALDKLLEETPRTPLDDRELARIAREVGISENAISVAHGYDPWDALTTNEARQIQLAREAVEGALVNWQRRVPRQIGNINHEGLETALNTALSESKDIARRGAESTLFSYRYTHGDLWLNTVQTYPYWGVRYGVLLTKYVAQNYRQARAFLMVMKMWDEETRDLPPSMRWSVRVFDLPDGTQVRFNPFTLFFPIGWDIGSIVKMGEDQTLAADLDSFFALAKLYLGGATHPALGIATRFGLDQLGVKLPEEIGGLFGVIPPVEEQVGRLVPQQPLVKALLASTGDDTGIPTAMYTKSLLPREKRAIQHTITNMLQRGEIDAPTALQAMRDLDAGVINQTALDAQRETMGRRGQVALARYLGAPISYFDAEWQTMEEVRKEYLTAQSDEERKRIIDENPGLPVSWAMSADVVEADYATRRALAWHYVNELTKERDGQLSQLDPLDTDEHGNVWAWYNAQVTGVLEAQRLSRDQVFKDYKEGLESFRTGPPAGPPTTPSPPDKPPERKKEPTEREKREQQDIADVVAESKIRMAVIVDSLKDSELEKTLIAQAEAGTLPADMPLVGQAAVDWWVKGRVVEARKVPKDTDGINDWETWSAMMRGYDAKVKSVLSPEDYVKYETGVRELHSVENALKAALNELVVEPFMAAPDKDLWKEAAPRLTPDDVIRWLMDKYPFRFDPTHPDREEGDELWSVTELRKVFFDGVPDASGYLDLRTDEKVAELEAALAQLDAATSEAQLAAAKERLRGARWKQSNDAIVNEQTLDEFKAARKEFNRWKYQRLVREGYQEQIDLIDDRIYRYISSMSLEDVVVGKYRDQVNVLREAQQMLRDSRDAEIIDGQPLQKWTLTIERFFSGERTEGDVLTDALRELVAGYWNIDAPSRLDGSRDFMAQQTLRDMYIQQTVVNRHGISQADFEAELYKNYPPNRLFAVYWFEKNIQPALDARTVAKQEYGGIVPAAVMAALGRKYGASTVKKELEEFLKRFPNAAETISVEYGSKPGQAKTTWPQILGNQKLPGFLDYWTERYPPAPGRGGVSATPQYPRIPGSSGSAAAGRIPSFGSSGAGQIPGASSSGAGRIPGL